MTGSEPSQSSVPPARSTAPAADTGEDFGALRDAEILAGANSVNYRLGQVIGRLLESSAQVYALTELLRRAGVVDVPELDDLRAEVLPLLHEDAHTAGLTVELGREQDKYNMTDLPDIDCAAIVPVCRAACCRLPFAVSEQDLSDGVQWDLAHPYLIRQRADTGYCVHCVDGERSCAIYSQRPAPCRTFDCRNDRRIWMDFGRRELNPDLAAILAEQG